MEGKKTKWKRSWRSTNFCIKGTEKWITFIILESFNKKVFCFSKLAIFSFYINATWTFLFFNDPNPISLYEKSRLYCSYRSYTFHTRLAVRRIRIRIRGSGLDKSNPDLDLALTLVPKLYFRQSYKKRKNYLLGSVCGPGSVFFRIQIRIRVA